MSEFEESRTLTCPCCKKRFAECEGPLCSCEEDAWDELQEMREAREAMTRVGEERLREP